MQPAAAPAAVGATAPGHAQLPLHVGVDRAGSVGDVALGDRTTTWVRIEQSFWLNQSIGRMRLPGLVEE